MKILIVDDSEDSRLLIKTILKKGGYADLLTAESARQAFEYLGINGDVSRKEDVDLILMDILMPDMDGIKALERIKKVKSVKDIPVIMITAVPNEKRLQHAFDAGAMDFITKPFKRIELLARVKSLLRLKQETDERLTLMTELETVNVKLKRMTIIDGLTGLANRRYFDKVLEKEWRRGQRLQNSLSMIMLDIDLFKKYNDYYGHLQGDECLIRVARTLGRSVKRSADLVARYGGEEFVIILPNTSLKYARKLAERARKKIERLNIAHDKSDIADHVTISIGVASMVPEIGFPSSALIEAADEALYTAKKEGRNRVVSSLPQKDMSFVTSK